MRFRKKPIVIEAEQFFPNKEPWPDGVEYNADPAIDAPKYIIQTLEGLFEVSPGDWVITGVKDEKYPCKPDIFEQTYDWVDA